MKDITKLDAVIDYGQEQAEVEWIKENFMTKNHRTKIFMDTEFTGLHKNTTLISIGLIDENGKGFYAELHDYDHRQVDEWIKDNVISNLHLPNSSTDYSIGVDNPIMVRGGSIHVMEQLQIWLEKYEIVEIWGDCLAYDWVLFCELFGGAMTIPGNVFYIPFDLSTLFRLKDIDPDVNRNEFGGLEGNQHNAFSDAKAIKACFEKLMEVEQ